MLVIAHSCSPPVVVGRRLERLSIITTESEVSLWAFTMRILISQGQRDYVNLLREAIQDGTDETLAERLREHRRLLKTLPRRKPGGGYSIVTVPVNASQTLAESEFNRYYIRALARRALDEGIPELVVYRARLSRKPRPASEARAETTIPPEDLLEDLRSHPGEPTTL